MISAKIIEDSISLAGKRITTLELSYPRCILSEVNTHRALSRSSMSSRAIPVAKMLEQVRNGPFVPHVWGMNQPGMQSYTVADESTENLAYATWMRAAQSAAHYAETLSVLGIHKQIANRLLEPFQWTRTIVTATEWGNLFELRDHPAAEPHFQLLARAMKRAMEDSTPTLRFSDPTDNLNWHLPYIQGLEGYLYPVEALAKISSARCARVSYLNHDGTAPSVEADLALYERLAGSVPIHASPLEHIAAPMQNPEWPSRNFRGWAQYRSYVEELAHLDKALSQEEVTNA